jgi:FkbM family methyltransferase
MPLAGYLRNSLLFLALAKRESIVLLGRGELYIDLKDNRGRAIRDAAGVTQPFTAWLWRRLVRALDPQIVLDIGANYGEIAFSSTYGSKTQIHLFEPNPYVRAYLGKSASTRADFRNFHLHSELVGSNSGQQTFVIDRKWSGTSSAVGRITESDSIKGPGEEQFEEVSLPSITIDECLASSGVGAGARILFKIDVEGYEGHVVSGMENTLRNASAYAGLVEFDRTYLTRAGTNPDALVRHFKELGFVRGVAGNRIFDLFDPLPGHFDLLVASSPSILDKSSRLGLARPLFPVKY